jgi:plasmid stability protein
MSATMTETVSLTIKKIPVEVYEHLKSKAASQGRSLNSEIIELLSAEAAEAARRKRMRETRKDLEAFVASLPPMESSVPLIREDRER